MSEACCRESSTIPEFVHKFDFLLLAAPVYRFATMPISYVSGFTHVFCTLENPNTNLLWVHVHCIFSLMGAAYLLNAWKNMDTISALAYTVVVIIAAVLVYIAIDFSFRVRRFLRYRFRASLSSKASTFLIQGFAVQGILAYFACEVIGNCVISNDTFTEEKCDQYARATCIVGFQVMLAWIVQLILFQTGSLSYYKVLVLDLSAFQWMGAIGFICCTLLAMVCYVTKQNSGVPSFFLIVSLGLSLITLIFMGSSINFNDSSLEDENDMSEYEEKQLV